jgi:hypothetical protein
MGLVRRRQPWNSAGFFEIGGTEDPETGFERVQFARQLETAPARIPQVGDQEVDGPPVLLGQSQCVRRR